MTFNWSDRKSVALLCAVAALAMNANTARAQIVPGQALEDLFIVACGSASGTLLTLCTAANAVNGSFALSGDGQASVSPGQTLTSNAAAIGRAYAQTDGVRDRLEEEREEKAGRPSGRNAGEDFDFGRFSMYLNLAGEEFDRERINDVDQETGYDGWKAGFQIGGDYRVGDRLVVGALIGFDHSESKYDADFLAPQGAVPFVPGDSQGGTRSDSVTVNVYASYGVTDNFYVDGTIGIGYTTFDRNFIFQSSGRAFAQNAAATGLTHGYEVNASVGMGYDFYSDALSIGPYVRVSYGRSTISEYTEEDRNGSGLNMTVREDTSDSLTGVIGVQASYAISQDWGVLIPQVRVEFEREFRNDIRAVTSSFAQSSITSTLALTTDAPERNYVNFGASILLVLPNGWMPFVDVEMLLAYEQLERRRYTAGLRVEF